MSGTDETAISCGEIAYYFDLICSVYSKTCSVPHGDFTEDVIERDDEMS